MLNKQLGNASVTTDEDTLTISTGQFKRQWHLHKSGLATRFVSFGKQQKLNSMTSADWNYPGWIDANAKATLTSLTATISDDNQFTSRHINVNAEFDYPELNTQIRYQIWVYPDAQGLRTQLWAKGKPQTSAGQVQGPQLQLLQGKAIKQGYTAKKQLAFRIKELSANQTYTAKVFADTQLISPQRLVLTSLDGEFKVDIKQSLTAKGTVEFELPETLRPDGTVTLLVIPEQGDIARVKQIKIYPKTTDGALLNPTVFPTKQDKSSINGISPAMHARVDFVPIHGQQVTAAGYYNDTQHRHTAATPLIKEQVLHSQHQVDWASLLFIEESSNGFALVKESPKCVNQFSVDTGQFIIQANGIETTGWGLSRADLKPDEWRWAWATWGIAYQGTSRAERELALKRFHRTRYPVNAELDLYTKANTWGSGNGGTESKQFAKESEVLAEIKSVADLGLDALQIDDGWQMGRMPNKPKSESTWRVRPDWYPQGWRNVVAAAQDQQIKLGIWHAAKAPLADLKDNYDQAGFTTWKLDFANLSKYQGAFSYLNKARELIEYSDHQLRVNWDVTENAPRFGYYWATEAGNLWLANRKPETPKNVIPQPTLMLREVWQIARYLNLNKIELPVVNFAMVNKKASDAHLHSSEYATALGLPGIPVFFQTTRFLTKSQREQTKQLLAVYKQHREQLFNAYVFPIGEEPNGKSIAGFQWFDPKNPNQMYLLLFKERLNTQKQTQLKVNFLQKRKNWRVENLLNKTGQNIQIEQGVAKVSFENSGEIAFVRLTNTQSTN